MKTIVQISDTHLMDSPNKDFIEQNPERSFHHTMHHILSHHLDIDTIIHTGDIAQIPKITTYQRYLNYMQNLNIPFYQTPGNHDDPTHFPYPKETQISTISLGHWCIILLNSAIPSKIDGFISQKQLKHLEKLLHTHQKQHILIGCHHHPVAMQSAWIDEHCLKNTDQLMDLLCQYSQVKAVIHGHVHQEATVYFKHLPIFSVPSTFVQFKPLSQDFALDDNLPGYRVLKLYDDGHLDTEVFRVEVVHKKINLDICGY